MDGFKTLKYFSLGLSIIVTFLIFYIILNYTTQLNTLQFIIVNGLSITTLYFISNYISSLIFNTLLNTIVNNKWNEPVSRFLTYLELTISNDTLVENIKTYLEAEAGFSVILEDKGRIVYKTHSRFLEDEKILKSITSIDKTEGIKIITYNEIKENAPRYEIAVSITNNQTTIYIISKYISLINKTLITEIYNRLRDFTKRRDIVEKMFEVSALTHEWELLSQIQKFFLPDKLPQIDGLDVSVFFKPLVNVSGDYYYILPTKEGKEYLFVIGDVAGKGLNASLLMAVIINTIKINKENSLKDILYEVDKVIKVLNFEGKYTTIFLGKYDIHNNTFEFINCAMPKAILVRENQITTFPSNAPIVGIIELPEFETTKIELKKGDLLLITSDGLTEARDKKDVEYQDTDRLKEILLNSKELKSGEIVNRIAKDVEEFISGTKQSDDITYVILKKE
ncbi:MAG: PP2C family protein-serine/threonine phosphatase [Brevinematales bacterium]|nr:PP2C family protein-serine/threonine phosphatase [Brevinematales bacterium]